MDKFFIRKDVYEELLEKGFGKRDYSKLTKKKITDKNGHTRTVYVRDGEQPAEVKQPKAQEGLSDEKKAKYEEMLEKVKTGSDENALFVRGEMLNKKDAIDYLEKKLGRKNGVIAEQKMKMEDEKKDAAMKDHETKSSEQMLDEKAKENFKKDARKMSDKGLEQKIKNLTTPGSLDYQVYSNPEQIAKVFEEELNRRKAEKNSSAEGHLESDTPQNTDITKEDEERFGKQALSGLSGKRTSSEEYDDVKAFEEYKELVTKNSLTDEEYGKIGKLVKEHYKHSKEPWPGGAKLREENGTWQKRFDSLKVGDEITSYGTKMKITKKNENNKKFTAEFTTKDGKPYETTLSIMDVDDSVFDKKKPSQDDM